MDLLLYWAGHVRELSRGSLASSVYSVVEIRSIVVILLSNFTCSSAMGREFPDPLSCP
jgi:hypothetical protein